MSTDVLRDRVGVVVKIEDMIIQRHLRWYGHVMRGDNFQISEVMEVEITEKRSTKEIVGRVRKERFGTTWLEKRGCVRSIMALKGMLLLCFYSYKNILKKS